MLVEERRQPAAGRRVEQAELCAVGEKDSGVLGLDCLRGVQDVENEARAKKVAENADPQTFILSRKSFSGTPPSTRPSAP